MQIWKEYSSQNTQAKCGSHKTSIRRHPRSFQCYWTQWYIIQNEFQYTIFVKIITKTEYGINIDKCHFEAFKCDQNIYRFHFLFMCVCLCLCVWACLYMVLKTDNGAILSIQPWQACSVSQWWAKIYIHQDAQTDFIE